MSSLAALVRNFLSNTLGFELDFISDVELAIAGFSGSTQVDSLLSAFESLNITATLPGLKSSLLSSGSLESKSQWILFC